MTGMMHANRTVWQISQLVVTDRGSEMFTPAAVTDAI